MSLKDSIKAEETKLAAAAKAELIKVEGEAKGFWTTHKVSIVVGVICFVAGLLVHLL